MKTKRYQLILDPSKHTDKRYHNVVYLSEDVLQNLSNAFQNISADQPWHIFDPKNNHAYPKEEFFSIINKTQK